MWKNQLNLNHLPINNDLNNMLNTFIESIEPLVKDENELLNIKSLAEKFIKEENGLELQKLLEKKHQECINNTNNQINNQMKEYYLNNSLNKHNDALHPDGLNYPNTHFLEKYWESLAYLSFDETLLWSNVFQSGFHNSTCDESLVLNRAASVVCGFLNFRHELLSGDLILERAGRDKYFCNSQMLRILSTTRVPGKEVDILKSDHFNYNHICVQCKGYWYQVQVINDPMATNHNNIKASDNIIDINILEDLLKIIKNDAENRKTNEYPVMVLSATNRRKWYDNRLKLLVQSENNGSSLKALETSIFNLILSDLENPPTTFAETEKALLFGKDCTEIHYDKCIQWVTFKNGVCGVHIEHAAADAVVPARIALYASVYAHLYGKKGVGFNFKNKDEEKLVLNIPMLNFNKLEKSKWNPFNNTNINYIKDIMKTEIWHENNKINKKSLIYSLDFFVDENLKNEINEAKKFANNIKNNQHELDVVNVSKNIVGTQKEIKKLLNVAPDSFMQIVLQLAYYRDLNEIPPTYETATTRGYLHGRTETIRTQSKFSKNFVESFDDKSVNLQYKYDMFKKACDYHRNYTKKAMSGLAVDRQLLCLKLIALDNNLPIPSLLNSDTYKNSTNYLLSTSQMPMGFYDIPGFSAPSSDAYGCCYRFVYNGGIIATVTNRSGNNKNAIRFRKQIEKAIVDVYTTFATNDNDIKQKSKL